MARYVDGFVVPVPKDKVEDYKKIAQKAGAIWKEYGALEYLEAVADDVKPGKVTSFPQSVDLKDDEVVVFAYIVYESRDHRDEVNAKVFADPRMKEMECADMPFDGKRMFWGGFSAIVDIR
jgi:uncharacterized protein YbaA (DUF1428 family)